MSRQQGIEFLIKVLGKEQVKAALDEVEKGVQKGGKANEEAAGKADKLANALAGMAKAAMGTVTAFLGINAVVNLFRGWYDYVVRIRQAMVEMANQAAQTQKSFLDLANQLGVPVPEAVKQAGAVSQASGSDLAMASEALRATSSAAGQKAVDAGVPEVVAGALARTGGTADEATAMVELLTRMPGAMDSKEKAAAAINAIEKASNLTFFKNLGEMASAVGRGGLPGLNEGAPTADIVARQAQARAVTANPMQSMRLMEQLSLSLADEDVRKVISRQAGKQFHSLSWTEQLDALGQAILSKQGNKNAIDKMLKGAAPEMQQRIIKFFGTPSAVETYNQVRQMIAGGGNAQQLLQENEQFKGTLPAQASMSEAGQTVATATMPEYELQKGKLREEAKAELERQRALGKIKYSDELGQLSETQIKAAEYAIQLKRLGIAPTVVPGTMGSDTILEQQLLAQKQKLGLPVESKTESIPSMGEYDMGGGEQYTSYRETGPGSIIGAGKQNGRPIIFNQGSPGQGEASRGNSGPVTVNNNYIGQQINGTVIQDRRDPTVLPPDAMR